MCAPIHSSVCCPIQDEVRSIVRKRTQFEYAVRRRAPVLVDFLRYAQYEMNLDALRKKRRNRLAFRRVQVRSAPLFDVCAHASFVVLVTL